MSKWLVQFVESGFLPADDVDVRRKKIALTLVPLIIGTAAFVWGSVYFLLDRPLSGSIPMTYSIISAFSLVYYFKTKKTGFIEYSQLLLVLLLPFLLMWSLGGFSAGSMVMIWALFAPVASLMFMQKRYALLWFLAYFFLIIFSGLIDALVSEQVPALPGLVQTIFFLLNMCCASAGLYLLVSYSFNEEKRAINNLMAERKLLEKSTRELNIINQQLNDEIVRREQVQVELEVEKRRTDESNRILHTVLDTVPVSLYWKDKDLIYLGCNQHFADDANKSSEEDVIGKTDYDMDWHKMADQYRADDEQVLASNQPKLHIEEKRFRYSGTVNWLRSSKVPLRDTQGDVIGVLGAYEDITEEKQVAEKLVVALNEAEKSNLAKSEFLSSMSHELRTPLNAILGFAQLFEFDDELTDKQKVNASEITKAGNHLLLLVNEVLDLARIESGYVALTMEKVSLLKIVEECEQLVAPLSTSCEVELNFDQLKQSDLYVYADYVRLKQVVLNLMSNAVKYNRKNGTVDMSYSINRSNVIRLSVSDTGRGIPEDKQENLFHTVSRHGKEFGEIEGAGIGLIVNYQLVELMGGDMGVDSIVDKGSTFWLELNPANDADLDDANDSVKGSKSSHLEKEQTHILIAEDNETIQMVLQQQLKLLDYENISIAEDGKKAYELWLEGNFHLLLTDINMPLMNGYALVDKIRNAEKTSGVHMPVIAITANAVGEDRERCLEGGMDSVITKPITLEDLQLELREWLHG